MDWTKKAREFRGVVQWYAATLSDEQAAQAVSLYPAWEPGQMYEAQALLTHNGLLHPVEQAHVAQAHQPPGGEGMLAIYRPIRPAGGEPVPWVYGEAVEVGDRRIDPTDGRVYQVTAPAGANLWEPHTVPALWTPVEELDGGPDGEEPEEAQAAMQAAGAGTGLEEGGK